MSAITQLKTMKEVFEYIDETHPGWVIDMYDGYSKDYKELDDNWRTICEAFKTTPKRIILIEKLQVDDHFSFAELLSQCGFVVRTRYEFSPCATCRLLIPNEEVYNRLKSSGKAVPELWNSKCQGC
jgi:hypothetical protein